MADLSFFRQLAASCATMLPLLPKEEQDEARKIVSRMLIEEVVDDKDQSLEMVGKMLIKEVDDKTEDDKTEALARIGGMVEVEDKKAVSKMLTSDEDKKFVKVEVVEQEEDRGPKIFEASEANVKPSDVDEILARYKIVTDVKEMEVDAVKVESKERSTFSHEKEEGEKEVAEKDAEEEKNEEEIKEKENTFESLQEVAKSEDVIFDANKSPETKSESRWWKKRRSIDVFEDVEMPLKKIKTEKSEIDSETKSPGGEAKKRQWSKCGECKGWFSKKY